ncbi:MAG: hypothetical protein WCR06_03295 [bacterium]
MRRRECRRSAACGRWRQRHLTITLWGWGSPKRLRLYVAGACGRWGGDQGGRYSGRPDGRGGNWAARDARFVTGGTRRARGRATVLGVVASTRGTAGTIRASATRRLGEQARAARTAHVS